MDVSNALLSSQNNDASLSLNRHHHLYMDRSAGEMTLLPASFVLGENDVLCGRGKNCFRHSGNQRFRKLVQDCLGYYTKAPTKADKTMIIREIISFVRAKSQVGGFVKHDPLTGRYYEIGDKLAREKTSQAFRDALYGENRASNTFKEIRHASRIPSLTSVGDYENQDCDYLFQSAQEDIQRYRSGISLSKVHVVSSSSFGDNNYTKKEVIETSNASSNDDYSNWFPSRLKAESMSSLFADVTCQISDVIYVDKEKCMPAENIKTIKSSEDRSDPSPFEAPNEICCCSADNKLFEVDNQVEHVVPSDCRHDTINISDLVRSEVCFTDGNVETKCDEGNESNAPKASSCRRNSLDWENLLCVTTNSDWWLPPVDDLFDL